MCYLLALAVLAPNCQETPPYDVHVSFYTRAEGWNGGALTYSGLPVREGYVASNWLALGTRFVLWDKEYVVQDRGGGLGNRQIDVFFEQLQDGYDWLWRNRSRQPHITLVFDNDTETGQR